VQDERIKKIKQNWNRIIRLKGFIRLKYCCSAVLSLQLRTFNETGTIKNKSSLQANSTCRMKGLKK